MVSRSRYVIHAAGPVHHSAPRWQAMVFTGKSSRNDPPLGRPRTSRNYTEEQVPGLLAGAYTAACTSAGCRVLLAVTEAYNSKSKELDCSGHRTVELLDKRMVDLDMAPLAVALEESNPFVVVDVSYNTLGAGAAESLRKLVATDGTITSLDLSQNDFTESASQALCSGLKLNHSITCLLYTSPSPRDATLSRMPSSA